MTSQVGDVPGCVSGRDTVSHQPLVARTVLAQHDHALRHRRVFFEHRLDLSQLDAKTAKFDLIVKPSQEFQIPVRAPAAPVARPVEPRMGSVVKGIGRRIVRLSVPDGSGSRGPGPLRQCRVRPARRSEPVDNVCPTRTPAYSQSGGRSNHRRQYPLCVQPLTRWSFPLVRKILQDATECR